MKQAHTTCWISNPYSRAGVSLLATLLLVALLFVLPGRVAAEDPPLEGRRLSDKVELHGFGGWAFGVSDGNGYQLGSEEGELENFELTLHAITHPIERLTLVAQVNLASSHEDLETAVDYAFAEWAFSDGLRLRLGQATHPFGIYGDVLRVGTLRSFLLLPQSIYGPGGMVADRYRGLALTGDRSLGGWEIGYDLYVGDAEIHIERPWLVIVNPGALHEDEHRGVEDVVGARLQFTTPIDGLRFGVSGYLGDQESALGGRIPSGRHQVYGLHVEYHSDRWLLRGEYAHHDHLTAMGIDGAYLEVMRRVGKAWEVAARYDHGDVAVNGFPIQRATSLWKHRDAGLSLSRWFARKVAVRAEVHRVAGNRFALPADLADAVAAGALDETTDLFQLGVQFSF